MTILKAGMHIQHNAKNSSRYRSIGVVTFVDREGEGRTAAKGKPNIVVCWLSGGNLQPGQTALTHYRSLWLEDNVIVLGAPISDTPISAASYAEQFEQASTAIAKGPYYCNVVGSGNEPHKKHDSLTVSKLEAARLSRTTGKRVEVLAVVGTVRQKVVTTTTEEWL